MFEARALMTRLLPRLSYANVVSTLCLLIVLGGGAYAATKLPRNSVGTKQLKANAVKGPKVADGSLDAADIGGPVASAERADRAASADRALDADRLGGTGAGGFLAADAVKRIDARLVQPGSGQQRETVLTSGPFSLSVFCNGGSSQSIFILAASSAPSAEVGWGVVASDAPTTQANTTPLSESPTTLISDSAQLPSIGTGEIIYRDDDRTVSIDFKYVVGTIATSCDFQGVATEAGGA